MTQYVDCTEKYRSLIHTHKHTHACMHAQTHACMHMVTHTYLYIITIESPVDTLDHPWLKGMATSSPTHTPHLHKDTQEDIQLYLQVPDTLMVCIN